ncbi:malonyl-[acyl-carrier protein] O-methyltransferase BioC, partial [Neisseria meningitidis]|nr:malonyl-[acyl-carrier protein] O-methyltransferase BioC [Neisseria meningitidis]
KNLNGFIGDYLSAFGMPSGKVHLTYHPLFFIARYSAAGRQ